MGYNYDRRWLAGQTEMVEELLHLAATSSQNIYEYDDLGKLDADRNYVRAVRANAEVHYPQHAKALRRIRTWKEIDRNTGAIYLHIGTENNYVPPRRALKSSGGRMVDTGKLRGAKPTSTLSMPSPAIQTIATYGTQAKPNKEPDVFEIDDELTESNLTDLIPNALLVADMRNSQLIKFKSVTLLAPRVKQLLENLPAWSHDDSTEVGGVIKSLTLRRIGELTNDSIR